MEAMRALLPAPPPTRATPPPRRPATEQTDFDVEVAVESDEPVEAMELTGRVVLTEDGKVSAVLKGDTITAGPMGAPARPPPPPAPPRTAAAVREESAARKNALERTEGKLEDNLPDLITAFYLAQQTGELTLQKGKVKKTIFFEKGLPCFAISNLIADRFGPFLVRVGKISNAQLELCQAAAEKTGRKTGDVLGEMGLLKETEKLYYVAQQVKAIVYSAFGWEEGEYRLHFADRAGKEAIKIDLHPANLITRGVKKLYKPERLYRLLSPEDRLIPSPAACLRPARDRAGALGGRGPAQGGRDPHAGRAHPHRPAPRARRVRVPVRPGGAQDPRAVLSRPGVRDGSRSGWRSRDLCQGATGSSGSGQRALHTSGTRRPTRQGPTPHASGGRPCPQPYGSLC